MTHIRPAIPAKTFDRRTLLSLTLRIDPLPSDRVIPGGPSGIISGTAEIGMVSAAGEIADETRTAVTLRHEDVLRLAATVPAIGQAIAALPSAIFAVHDSQNPS